MQISVLAYVAILLEKFTSIILRKQIRTFRAIVELKKKAEKEKTTNK